MAYQYNGPETIAAEQARQQKLQAELRQARQAYQTALKLDRENQRIEAEIHRIKQRTAELAKPLPHMPEPVHGGRHGLKRAAQEVAQWEAKQRAQKAAA